MFGLKKKLARAGALAGVSAAVMAVGGIGASSAVAAPNCEPAGVDIVGKGASLQKKAQEVWTGRTVASNPAETYYDLANLPQAKGTGGGYYGECLEGEVSTPSVTYGSTGSGAGLTAFRFNGAGNIDKRIAYIGTDDAPSAAQIENAENAPGNEAEPIIIPVSQTAIAVVANVPAGCSITGGITWTDLNKLFNGTITTWTGLTTDNGNAACNTAIKRVVRSEGSGTTVQFKNYLSTLETTKSAAGPGCALGTWAALMSSANNTVWPECEGTTTVVKQAGGSNVAKYVKENSSTIGYAALPDAKAQGAVALSLQSGTGLGGAAVYAKPDDTTNNTARCTNARYSVPADGRKGTGDGEAVDWSTVFGAQPGIGTTAYPLCTLTFAAAWNDYVDAGYEAGEGKENPEDIQDVVRDYLANYVVPVAEGQTDLVGNWYAALPSVGAEGSETNVQDAATFAASKIQE